MDREPSPELRRRILAYQWTETDAHDALECSEPYTVYGPDYSRNLADAARDVCDMIGRNGDVAHFTAVLVLRLYVASVIELSECSGNLILEVNTPEPRTSK